MISINKGTNGAYMSNVQFSGVDNSVYQKICVEGSEMYITDDELTSSDYVIVFAGTNDCAHNIKIGDVNDISPDTFYGALNLICNKLKERAPSAKIAFITPYLRANIEEKSQNHVNAIKNVCVKYNIPVFDNAQNGGIDWSNPDDIEKWTLGDSYHLNEEGQEMASYKYEEFLKNI